MVVYVLIAWEVPTRAEETQALSNGMRRRILVGDNSEMLWVAKTPAHMATEARTNQSSQPKDSRSKAVPEYTGLGNTRRFLVEV